MPPTALLLQGTGCVLVLVIGTQLQPADQGPQLLAVLQVTRVASLQDVELGLFIEQPQDGLIFDLQVKGYDQS